MISKPLYGSIFDILFSTDKKNFFEKKVLSNLACNYSIQDDSNFSIDFEIWESITVDHLGIDRIEILPSKILDNWTIYDITVNIYDSVGNIDSQIFFRNSKVLNATESGRYLKVDFTGEKTDAQSLIAS
jgi:hypothetical protein